MCDNLIPGAAGDIFLSAENAGIGAVSRFAVSLTMSIDSQRLERAVNEILALFPCLCAEAVKTGDRYALKPCRPSVRVLCGKSAAEHSSASGDSLLRVSCSGKSAFFDWHLSVCDEKGMAEFVKSVIYRYIQLCGYPVSSDGSVRTTEDFPNPFEGTDPYVRLEDMVASRPVWYMDAKAYCMLTPDATVSDSVYQIRIPVSKVKNPVRQYLSQPEAFVSPVFAHVLREIHSSEMGQGEYIVASIRENLRPYFHTASLRPFFTYVTLAYNRNLDEYPFNTILMSQKKLLDAQLKQDTLIYSVNRLIRVPRPVEATFSVCNMGNVVMPESLSRYITEFYPVFRPDPYSYSLSMVNFKGDLVVTVASRNDDMALPRRFAELLVSVGADAFVADESGFARTGLI